ncbi:MAG: DNA alkylation repair protein [Verrucomicrobiia bacterium]
MSRSDASEIRAQLRSFADPGIARHAEGFFKTAKGEYGAGDQFHGVRMPKVRKVGDDGAISNRLQGRSSPRQNQHNAVDRGPKSWFGPVAPTPPIEPPCTPFSPSRPSSRFSFFWSRFAGRPNARCPSLSR